MAGGVALLEALREAGVRRLVFSSTAAVYGTPAGVPIREDAVLAPINPYGETKRAFEGALRWYAGAYGLRSVSLRYFNVAGASGRNGEVHDPETHLIPNVLAAVEGRGGSPSSGPTTRPRTGPASATTSTSRTWPGPTSSPSRRRHPMTPGRPAASAAGGGTPATVAAAIALNLGNGGGFSVREVLAAAEAAGRPVPHRDRGASRRRPAGARGRRERAARCWAGAARPDLVEIVASAWAWRRAHPGGYGA